MKTTCRRISNVLHQNRSKFHLKLEVHDNIKRDSTTFPSTFITHFSEVAPSLNTDIPSLPDNAVENMKVVSNQFLFRNTEIEKVYKIIFFF